MTERGSQLHANGKNRPVLRRANGDFITQSVAEGKLGGFIIMLHHSQLRLVCSTLEGLLQRHAHDYGLGRRLHRVVDAGASGIDPDETVRDPADPTGVQNIINPDYLSKVGLTCFRVTEWRRNPRGVVTGMRVGGEMLQVVQ